MVSSNNKIYQLYLKLRRKHGDARNYWPGWCARRKSPKDREEIAIGAILTQRTNWNNVEMALKNLREHGLLSIKGVYQLKASHSFVQPAPRASVDYGQRDNIQQFPKGGVRGALEKGDAPLPISFEYLGQLIRSTGFYRQKAKRLWEFCRMITEEYGGLTKFRKLKVGEAREKLLSLWGIGPETADSILLYALGKQSFVIDEYTKRLFRRKKLLKNYNYDYMKAFLEKNLPRDADLYQDFHALIVVEEKGEKAAKMR